jgi:hypothetical protein
VQWFQALVLTLLAALGCASLAGLINLDGSVYPASLLLVTVVAWNFCAWRLAGRDWFEPYTLFLMSATLFNAGQVILEVCNLNNNGILGGKFSPESTTRAVYLVALGLASFHFGAVVALKPKHKGASECVAKDVYAAELAGLRLVGYICAAVSVVPVIVVLHDTVTTAIARGYGGLFGRSREELIPGPVLALASFFIPGAIFLIAGNRDKRGPAALAGLLVAAYSGAMLYAGSRGPAVMFLVAAVWLYQRSPHRLPNMVIVIAGMALLLTFPLIATLRNVPGARDSPIAALTGAFARQDSPVVAAVSEMGASLSTVAYTVDLVPTVRPFDYGVSYGYAVSTLFPNVGWDVHPAIAHGLWADWLIKVVDPSLAKVGGGLGYSFIAEAFGNFGWYGAAPALAVIGYLLMRLFLWGGETGDIAKEAAVAAFLGFFLLFARGESGTVVRGLGWYALGPYTAVVALTRRQARQAGRKTGAPSGLDGTPVQTH